MRKLFLSLLFVFFLSSVVSAGIYYVDDNGAASWVNCEHDGGTPGAKSGTLACALSTANSNADAGDTVYLRGGTYTLAAAGTYGIKPTNSGTSGNRITFEEYTGETVIITMQQTATDRNNDWATCISLEAGQSYITIRGITCQDMYQHLAMVGSSGNYASYNEIDSCTFTGIAYDNSGLEYNAWKGSKLEDYCEYNWIHDSTIEKFGRPWGASSTPDDHGVPLELGWDLGYIYTRYNVIEDNIIQYGGHHVIGVQGYRNVVRNNYIQNNGWMDATAYGGVYGTGYLYGGKVVYGLDIAGYGQHTFEGNRVSFADQSAESQSEGEGWLLGSPQNIIRYNVFDNNNEAAFYIDDAHGGCSGCSAEDNFIFNNTFWYDGHDNCTTGRGCSNVFAAYTHGVAYAAGDSGYKTMFKNNLFYNEDNEIDEDYSVATGHSTTYPATGDYYNNYESGQETEGDPFIQITDTPKDPEDGDQFDFNLKSTSVAIDGGTYLTLINESTGSGTAFNVDHAKYFQDGWGNGAGGGAVVYADWICVGTVSNCVQISSINYGTDEITVASSISWTDNDPVWLYKNSSGEIVLYGSAPDQGAYESGASATIETGAFYFEVGDKYFEAAP